MSGVAGTARAKADGPLKVAVPRGALLGETLDALDAIGVDTAAVRGESRALIFPGKEITLVTMRPSDVPTYVEAGAADVGITGKDVLLEQADRQVLRAARPRLRALSNGPGRSGRRPPVSASPSDAWG